MDLLRRFSMLCGAAFVLLAAILGVLITRAFESNAVEEANRYVAADVKASAKRHLADVSLSVPADTREYEALRVRLSDIFAIPGVLDVVVFSGDGTVVWSRMRSLVGTRLQDKPYHWEALRGVPVARRTRPYRDDPRFPGEVRELMELYVPLFEGDTDRMRAVVKIYLEMDQVLSAVLRTKAQIWAILLGGFAVLYTLLFVVALQGNRRIARGDSQLRESREKIRAQQARMLRQIGTSAMTEADLEGIVSEALQELSGLLGIHRCAVVLEGPPAKVIEHRMVGSPLADLPGSYQNRPGVNLEAMASGKTVVVDDAEKIFGSSAGAGTAAACLVVPLLRNDEVVGALFLDRAERHCWTGEEIGTAETVARQIALAARQARMFAEQQDLSRRLVSLMNNVPGMVYRGLPDWTLPFVGADIERFTGRSVEDFTSRRLRWLGVVHPDDIDPLRKRIREAVLAKERVLRLEYRLVHRDGGVRWVGDRRQMIYGDDGKLLWVDGLVLDITDRKKAEIALRLTQFTVDRGSDATYWMASDGRLLYVNDRTCEALGYTREELLAMRIQDINPDFPPERWPAHWDDLRRCRTRTWESIHRTKDGRTIPVEITANYIEFDGKEYNCASARDITERKRAEEESVRLQSQLIQAQKMEALGLLAGGIAHDFNNLLTGILGYATLLRQKPESGADVSKAAEIIQRAAERASHLTAQLLGFARKGKNLNVPVDLTRTVTGVTALLEGTLDRRIRIVTSFCPGDALVLGDPSQLDQVVMNLAVNACDAMPEGGRLRITTERVSLDDTFCCEHGGMIPGDYLLLSVGDTGVGIPRENLERIFDPFFTTKEQGKGTGLGLSMVFGIVKNHGGLLDVQSEVGVGTTFRVYLPENFSLKAKEAEGADDSALPHGRGKILLIDDQETVREVAQDMLRALGYEVITAVDGLDGVTRYRELWREIDLVVVDMIMPHLSGGDCFRRIKEINPHARVVLSSGYTMEGTIQEVMKEGILDFIQKPYRLEELSRVVGKALGVYH
ncbi:MAG: PAS domain S-box protein [Deltaproteobacteria bacterium]|nr:PAS domain S-box protein [Deltaproteobacteria bacterium]